MATFVSIALAISMQGTGINGINVFSSQIYKDIKEDSGGKGIDPVLGTFINSTVQAIACLVSPYVAYFSFRLILNGGLLIMGLSMMVVAGLAQAEANNILVVFIVIFLVFFQLTMGTYAWVYLGQVNCDEGLSIGTLVLWTGALILTLYTNKMFDEIGKTGTFCIFGAISLVSFVFFFFMLRETKGLSRDEAQRLYAK